MALTPPRPVLAAGVVAFRPGKQVLLVHRPRYDDWSFPKGKLDAGELLPACAVREAWEETGLHVRLGPALPAQDYPIAGRRTKAVSYWTARVVGDDDVTAYTPNTEVDEVRWVDVNKAFSLLTYPHDRETLEQARVVRRSSRPIIVLRHGQARSRKGWKGDDRLRPLLSTGYLQSQRLVPLLSAYAVQCVVTSSSTRCVETVTPYADVTGWALSPTTDLSEQDASPRRIARILQEARDAAEEGRGTVVCSHRPVLPQVFEALGVEDPKLAPGSMLVAHHRGGRIVATEVHDVPRGR